jgi:Lon protease-like protein
MADSSRVRERAIISSAGAPREASERARAAAATGRFLRRSRAREVRYDRLDDEGTIESERGHETRAIGRRAALARRRRRSRRRGAGVRSLRDADVLVPLSIGVFELRLPTRLLRSLSPHMTTPLLDASSTGLVPVFPLPDACLLPGESLPFFVFEPRYRRLLADALEGERLIALARLVPGYEEDYEGNPAVYPCMGVGEIVRHVPRPDGTSEIVLRGIARARLADVVKPLPYRLARLVDLPEFVSDPRRESALRDALVARLAPLAANFERVGCSLAALRAAPDIAWRLALLVDLDADVKQALLEADDHVERLEILSREIACDGKRERMRALLRVIERQVRRGGPNAGTGACSA